MTRGRKLNRYMKKLIILRGLPGVGKTRRAKKLCDEYARLGLEAEIFSTDRYHESTNYTKGNFQRNHQRNREDVFKALNRGVDLIIVDNTNISLWEMWPYIHMGMRQGDYYITMMELPKNYISINKLYRSETTSSLTAYILTVYTQYMCVGDVVKVTIPKRKFQVL
ncbi:NEDD4-binding protein 2-like 1 isoform X1 [Salvelinus sp. IW2-2015]|uniref:NEDD4-binding protein 2-like 1 isoform X1 n=1 Tax=Salvelinus sp. IW2-2015 TaxID=2691554 RepID=UPI000CDFA44C|nr:NEDD4-binding protein 2-like 1 isoform X1 [Salvelinus alpinus]